MFNILKKYMVDGKGEIVHIGNPGFRALAGGDHAPAGKRAGLIDRTGVVREQRARPPGWIHLLFRRVFAGQAEVCQAVGGDFRDKAWAVNRFFQYIQQITVGINIHGQNDFSGFQGGQGDIAGTAACAKFPAGNGKGNDKLIIDLIQLV